MRQDAVDDDRQACLPSFRELTRQCLERHRMRKHSLTFGQYCLPGSGQPDAIPVAIEQLETELPLELSQLIADRRLNAMQLLGGGREAAFADHYFQHLDGVEVDSHRPSKY
jgi:hypothetical protein